MISITKTIISILSANTSINQSVKGQIYSIVAPTSAVLPFIVCKRNSYEPLYCKDGCYENDIDYSVTVVSNKYSESIDLAEQIRSSLELKRTDIINSCLLSNITESATSDGAYIQEITFKIKTN